MRIWTALFPLAGLYRLILWAWERVYTRGWTYVERLPRPVVSVGNITVGGTGKTPLVMYLARALQEKGFRPAVLSRGYRRKGKGVGLVSDGKRVLMGPDEAGDEPYLLARKLPGVPVAVGRDRREAGELVLGRVEVSHFILDDGFQYRALARDIDIVVLDARDPFGGGHLLPWGLLREPPSALHRADVVCISRADQVPPEVLEEVREKVTRLAPEAILVECVHRPRRLQAPEGELPLSALRGKKVVALSGVGSPGAFERTLEDLGAEVVPLRFRDHHLYTGDDVAKAIRLTRDAEADAVVTTEKDRVRLPPDVPFWTLEVEVEEDGGRLRELMRSLAPEKYGSEAEGFLGHI